MNTTLELSTTQELVLELKRRYPLLLVAGSADRTETHAQDVLYCRGNLLSLIGLAQVVKTDLVQQYQDNLEPTDDTI